MAWSIVVVTTLLVMLLMMQPVKACISCIEVPTKIDSVRLSGCNETAGRLEVMVNEHWGTVCDDLFAVDNVAAATACRWMGYADGVMAMSLRYVCSPATLVNINLDDVNCHSATTRYSNLNNCSYYAPTQPYSGCGHNEDVYIVCYTTLEHIAPTTTTTTTTTTTPPPTTTTTTPMTPSFRPVIPPGIAVVVKKNGTVVTDNCPIPSPTSRVRLFGVHPGIGYVQVWADDGTWGFVCDDGWDIMAARRVCQDLCFTELVNPHPNLVSWDYAVNISNPLFALDDVYCSGQETSFIGSSTTVGCTHSPWFVNDCSPSELAAVTCVHIDHPLLPTPHPMLTCREGDMIAQFNRSRDPYLEGKHLSVYNVPSCLSFVVDDTTDPHFITARIPFDKCNTNVSQNATHIVYTNTIFMASTSREGDVTRVNEYLVHLRCVAPRCYVASNPIQPLTQAVTQASPFNFVISLIIYQDQYFRQQVPVYPHPVVLGGIVYFAVSLQSIDDRLLLVVTDCCAKANNTDKESTPTRDLYEEKCILESTMQTFPLSTKTFGFRFQSFAFVNYPLLWLECQAIVCLRSEKTSECDRSCNSAKPTARRRRRRDANDILPFHKKIFTVKSQPIIIQFPPSTSTDQSSTTPWPIVTAAAAAWPNTTATTTTATTTPATMTPTTTTPTTSTPPTTTSQTTAPTTNTPTTTSMLTSSITPTTTATPTKTKTTTTSSSTTSTPRTTTTTPTKTKTTTTTSSTTSTTPTTTTPTKTKTTSTSSSTTSTTLTTTTTPTTKITTTPTTTTSPTTTTTTTTTPTTTPTALTTTASPKTVTTSTTPTTTSPTTPTSTTTTTPTTTTPTAPTTTASPTTATTSTTPTTTMTTSLTTPTTTTTYPTTPKPKAPTTTDSPTTATTSTTPTTTTTTSPTPTTPTTPTSPITSTTTTTSTITTATTANSKMSASTTTASTTATPYPTATTTTTPPVSTTTTTIPSNTTTLLNPEATTPQPPATSNTASVAAAATTMTTTTASTSESLTKTRPTAAIMTLKKFHGKPVEIEVSATGPEVLDNVEPNTTASPSTTTQTTTTASITTASTSESLTKERPTAATMTLKKFHGKPVEIEVTALGPPVLDNAESNTTSPSTTTTSTTTTTTSSTTSPTTMTTSSTTTTTTMKKTSTINDQNVGGNPVYLANAAADASINDDRVFSSDAQALTMSMLACVILAVGVLGVV